MTADPDLTRVCWIFSTIRRMPAPFKPRMHDASAVGHPAPSLLSIWRMGFAVAISILQV
jgi:hypothetical protein